MLAPSSSDGEPRTAQTIRSLFDQDCRFKIPSYQRSYSWEKKQRKQFIEDLTEHPPGAPYYYGHFIFEDGEENDVALIIDGQQRLTTLALFLAAVDRELAGRVDMTVANLDSLRRRYLTGRVETVDDDQNVFLDLIRKGTTADRSKGCSKERLNDASRFFSKVASRADTTVLLRWVEILETAEITTFTVHSKVQATQIFTLQNSRGKELTDLEKLKAFLMFGIYLHASPAKKNGAIGQVERSFGKIYQRIEQVSPLMSEDAVLGHHDRAYSQPPYHADTPLENIRKRLASIAAAEDRVNEITDYAESLAATFQHVVDLEKIIAQDDVIADPVILDGHNSWPLLIKLYCFYGEALKTDVKIRSLLQNIEIVFLKLRFQHGRSSNDLIGLTKQLNDSPERLDSLCERMKQCVFQGFRWRGDFDEKVWSYLTGDYHYNTTFRYILWKYENDIRLSGDAQVLPWEYINSVENRRMDSTIEHIAPQNGNYTEGERARCINNLGNLLFMPRGLNSSLSDQTPIEKAKRLNTSYASHREVRDKILNAGGWGEPQIMKRKADLIDFIQRRWQLQEAPQP
jgi:hypothetical protein